MTDVHLRIVRTTPERLDRFFKRHPRFAELACLALMRAHGVEPDWTKAGREPPIRLVYEPDRCPVCRGRRYRGGAWWLLAGQNRKGAFWHPCCVVAYRNWRAPEVRSGDLIARQGGVCPETGAPLGPPAAGWTQDHEIDHRMPLWRVRMERDLHQWPDLLRFWGHVNLQALSPEGHRIKTAREARERAQLRRKVA